MFTNTVLVSAYRGAGRPEGNYYMERLIDRAAEEMGIDRLALRRRNQIKPSEIPYKASSGMQYDSGDFPARVRARDRGRRREGLQAAQARVEEARQAARARHRQLSGSHRAAEQGDGRHPLRAERRRHHHHRHARLRPGPRGAVRAGAVATSSACRSSASACCRATATSCSPAAAPAARARCMRAAPRSSKAPSKVIEQGQADRGLRARGLRGRHRVRAPAASPSRAPTARSASWSWPRSCAAD